LRFLFLFLFLPVPVPVVVVVVGYGCAATPQLSHTDALPRREKQQLFS
jgi:hypothetical protein